MGISLNGLTPANTYQSLIKVGDNSQLTATLKTLSDGFGTDLPMQVSTSGVNFTGTVTQNGNPITTNPSGVSGAIQFSDGSAFASDAANLFWDDTNKRLGIGTNAPDTTAHFKGGVSGAVGTRIATFEGSLPEILFKDTSNNTGFAIAKYGGIVYFVNTNSSGAYSSYSGLTNSQGQWSLGGGFNPSGTVHVKGSGSTSATTSLLVQNSSGTNNAVFRDNGEVSLLLQRTGKGLQLIDNLAPTQSSSYYHRGGVAEVSTSTAALNYFWWANNNGTYPNGVFAYNNGVFIVSSTQKNLNTASSTSAVLQADSTNRGFLPPRMTTTQKNAISSPASGLMVYDTDTNKLCCYNGTSWNDLF